MIAWLVALDSGVHSLWNLAKLGSFGYHVPWSLVFLVLLLGQISALLANNYKPRYFVFSIAPAILILIVRYY